MATVHSTPQPDPASMNIVEAMRGGRPQPQPQIVTQPKLIVPLKIAWLGGPGSGKTTSAALLSAALSKEFHGGAPVWATDPELGWKFPKAWLFRVEGIDLQIRTVATFKAMMQDLRDAERAGASVWNVELVKIWLEILKTCRKKSPSNWGNELSSMWTDFVNFFLNSKLHCNALGRVADVVEEVIDERNEIHRIKTGERMKAGGSNDFGFEPHLTLRMSLEQKPKKKNGQLLENEGRMVHCAYVTKDRTTVTNGATFRWSDKAGYKPGGYRQVWESIRPHFIAMQDTEDIKVDTSATSSDLIDDNGDSEWYARRQRKEVFSAELHASMDYLWGGTAVAAKQMRMKVFEHIFGFKSREAADAAPLDVIERGVRILQAFERRAKKEPEILKASEENILANLDIDIREHDEGKAEEKELPF